MSARWEFNRQSINEAIVRGCEDAAEAAILMIQRNIRENLSQAGTGVHYPGNPARSSAPGQPPATQTGRLQSAWQAIPRRRTGGGSIRFTLTAGGVPYAAILEFGGTTGRSHKTVISERPYIRPAVIDVIRESPSLFANAIANRLRDAFGKKK